MHSTSNFEDSSCLLDVGCQVINWKIVSFVDQGGFGKIFKAHDINDEKNQVIIKTESTPGRNYLDIEAEIYQQLSGKKGFPRLFWSGVTQFEKVFKGEKQTLNCRILVMELLGQSLSNMFSQLHHKFTLKTVCLIGIQMLYRIEDLHDSGVIHRDIKPSNFVLNKSGTVLYLLDFGLSEFYMKSGQHIPYKEGIDFKGTHKFASVNALKKIQQSRRDDIVGMAYNLIYLMNSLPWYDMKIDRKNRRMILGEIKSKTPTRDLTKGLPSCFQKILDYSLNLDFSARPDYEYMRNLLKRCLKENNINTDLRFEWEDDIKEKSRRKSRDDNKPKIVSPPLDTQNLCTNLLLQHLLKTQAKETDQTSLTKRPSDESQPTKKMKYSPNTPSPNFLAPYQAQESSPSISPLSFSSPNFTPNTNTIDTGPMSPLSFSSPSPTLTPTPSIEPNADIQFEHLPIEYKVKIPENPILKTVIDTLSNLVVKLRSGIYVEQLLRERQRENPLFAFLFEPKSDAGVYYQWRVYSLLNADTLASWRTEPFQMFVQGPFWYPPPLSDVRLNSEHLK